MPETAGMGGIMQYKPRKRGVTLVEILIVSTIIAIMAALSFPVFKIVQQREKERRLKKILLDIRSAIGGCKSQNSNKLYLEGYRNFVYSTGIELIDAAHTSNGAFKKARKQFIASGTTDGMFYPITPSHLCYNTNYTIRLATGTDAASEFVDINIQRRFLRRIPPHPFAGWYPNAHWEFRPAAIDGAFGGGPFYASSATDPWNNNSNPPAATGVIEIVSRGAGYALDGSNTDEW